MPDMMDVAASAIAKPIDISGITSDSMSGLQAGMDVAKRRQDLDAKKQELQFQRDQHDLNKIDWFHNSLKDVAGENNPQLRKIKMDQFSQDYFKISGQRMNPAIEEAIKKVPSLGDAILAAGQVHAALQDPSLNVPQNTLLQHGKQVMNLVSGDIGTYLKEMNGSKDALAQLQMQKALIGAKVATNQGAAAAGMSQEDLQTQMNQGNSAQLRVTSQQKMAAQTQVNKDSLMNAYKMRLDGAGRVYDLINDAAAGKVKTNKAFLGQLNAEVARLETGSQSPGLGQSEKTELVSAAAQLEGLKEKFTGKPEDAVPQAVIQQVKGTMDSMVGSYQDAIHQRYATLSAGLQPSQKPIVEAKKNADIEGYKKKFGYWKGMDAVAAEPEGQPQTNAAGAKSGNLTQDQQATARSNALARLKQLRASQPGALSFSEQTVKDAYKAATGKDLVE